jgi:hypothetical protein
MSYFGNAPISAPLWRMAAQKDAPYPPYELSAVHGMRGTWYRLWRTLPRYRISMHSVSFVILGS